MPTLAVTYDSLRREIGLARGWNRDPDAWSSVEQSDCDLVIAAGLSRFYWPTPAEGQPQHVWTFLRRVADISLAASTRSYELPEDFGGGATDMTFADGTGTKPATQISEDRIRAMYSASIANGTPRYFAIRSRLATDTAGTAYDLLVAPIPDTVYAVQVRYSIIPPTLSLANPHPLGGPQHAQTIIAACLAAAEEKLDDTTDGVYGRKFAELLKISISLDSQQFPEAEGSWSIDEHADGSLAVKIGYLKRLAGRELGYGADPVTWTHRQEQEVNLAVTTGLRKFYSPPLFPKENRAHEWSFLRPIAQLTLVSGEYTYDLPSDFASMIGPLTYAPGQDTLYDPVPIVGEHQVRQRLGQDDSVGRPCIAAVVAKNPDATGGTRYELILDRPADDGYVLSYRYQVNPLGMLHTDEVEPYGGQSHAQTVIEAVLAACEEQANKKGPHRELFLEQVYRSIRHDRMTAAPDTLGYNGDRSDTADLATLRHSFGADRITTYNGVEY